MSFVLKTSSANLPTARALRFSSTRGLSHPPAVARQTPALRPLIPLLASGVSVRGRVIAQYTCVQGIVMTRSLAFLGLVLAAAAVSVEAGSCREAKLCCPGRDSSCVVQKAPINAIIEDLNDKPCYCDHACLKLGDCCSDFKDACGGTWWRWFWGRIFDFVGFLGRTLV